MRRVATVSCHVERLLDDDVWRGYRSLVAARPAGFAVASLVRPPDPEAREDAEEWALRVRELARLGPLGHHTHFGGPAQARPVDAGAAERVRREAESFRSAGVAARFFCGGGWYMDADVAAVVAELGYVDASATSYPLPYVGPDAPRLTVPAPTWLRLAGGALLLELPATRSIGMLVRALARPGGLPEPVVHVHFHDWDVLDRRRRLALEAGLRLLRLRRRPLDLAALADTAAETAPELDFAQAARR